MRAHYGKPSIVHAGVLALSLVPASLCLAQAPATPPATTRYQVTVVRIKPDMIDEWIDLQNTHSVYSTVAGTSGDLYLLESRFPRKSLTEPLKTLCRQGPQNGEPGSESLTPSRCATQSWTSGGRADPPSALSASSTGAT